jgi:hypothetical protein
MQQILDQMPRHYWKEVSRIAKCAGLQFHAGTWQKLEPPDEDFLSVTAAMF